MNKQIKWIAYIYDASRVALRYYENKTKKRKKTKKGSCTGTQKNIDVNLAWSLNYCN